MVLAWIEDALVLLAVRPQLIRHRHRLSIRNADVGVALENENRRLVGGGIGYRRAQLLHLAMADRKTHQLDVQAAPPADLTVLVVGEPIGWRAEAHAGL